MMQPLVKQSPVQANIRIVLGRNDRGSWERSESFGAIYRNAEGQMVLVGTVPLSGGVLPLTYLHERKASQGDAGGVSWVVYDAAQGTFVALSQQGATESVVETRGSPSEENLGEKSILGLRCRGSKVGWGDFTWEFWFSEEAHFVLFERTKTFTYEIIYEVIELTRKEPDRSVFDEARMALRGAEFATGGPFLPANVRRVLASDLDLMLQLAAEFGWLEDVQILVKDPRVYLDTKDAIQMTPLIRASSCGNAAVVGVLLDSGAAFNAKDANLMTALAHASAKGHLAVVQKLLNAGTSVNEVARHGMTALHWAVAGGHTQVVGALLKAGADPTIRNEEGESPTQLAERLNLDSVLRLLKTWPS
jgi:hypothetical protein